MTILIFPVAKSFARSNIEDIYKYYINTSITIVKQETQTASSV